MKHRIMITSLNSRDVKEGLHYFYFSDGEKNVYCDAMTSAEAGSKYILANHKIDTILAFGSDSSYDEGDDLRMMTLTEGKSLYAADIENMSSYSLYRYRLAEHLDEINAEFQDVMELLDDSQQGAAVAFIRKFFNEKKIGTESTSKFNRFFDRLVRDDDLCIEMESRLRDAAEAAGADPEKFLIWTRNLLFRELRDASKMQLLEGNENIRIRFVSAGAYNDYEKTFTDLLIRSIDQLNLLSENEDETEVFLCLQNDNVRDASVLSGLILTAKSIPGLHLNVMKMMLSDSPSSSMAASIRDDSAKIEVVDLMSANKAFLRYGQTDLFMDFRNESMIRNPDIDRMLYALRNIDYGISLCDITDIERGIASLRSFFAEDRKISGDSFTEQYFNVIADGIRREYAPLIRGDSIEFIELVRWAYTKGFWQQTLTLIESRAPRDMVEKGIFFYCDSEENKGDIIEKLGRIYYELKPFEKYKLDDVEHYYIKFYSRWRTPHIKDNKEYLIEYTNTRMNELDTDDRELIRAHTLCKDRDALRDVLFAYYYVGDVRNATNHAEAEFSGFDSFRRDSDVSERVSMIQKAVEYFIFCYDKMLGLVPEIEEGNEIIRVNTSELAEYAKSIGRAPRDGLKDKGKEKDKEAAKEKDKEKEE